MEYRRWLDGVRAEPYFNAMAFVPFGLLFPIACPRLRWLTVLLGAQLSGAIELVQDVFLSWRSPTIEDVRWNSLGAVIGFAVFLVVLAAGYSGNMPRRGSSV